MKSVGEILIWSLAWVSDQLYLKKIINSVFWYRTSVKEIWFEAWDSNLQLTLWTLQSSIDSLWCASSPCWVTEGLREGLEDWGLFFYSRRGWILQFLEKCLVCASWSTSEVLSNWYWVSPTIQSIMLGISLQKYFVHLHIEIFLL